MARRPTTGNFATREELEENIRSLYKYTRMSVAAISRKCGITPSTGGKIIDSFGRVPEHVEFTPLERDQSRSERALTEEEMEAIGRMTENAKSVLGHCGHGYMPEPCRVHLDSRILNDVYASYDLEIDFKERPFHYTEYAWNAIRRRNKKVEEELEKRA